MARCNHRFVSTYEGCIKRFRRHCYSSFKYLDILWRSDFIWSFGVNLTRARAAIEEQRPDESYEQELTVLHRNIDRLDLPLKICSRRLPGKIPF